MYFLKIHFYKNERDVTLFYLWSRRRVGDGDGRRDRVTGARWVRACDQLMDRGRLHRQRAAITCSEARERLEPAPRRTTRPAGGFPTEPPSDLLPLNWTTSLF